MKDQQSCDRSKALWSTLELPVCSQYLDLQNRFYNNTKQTCSHFSLFGVRKVFTIPHFIS